MDSNPSEISLSVQKKDQQAKAKMKEHADKRSHAQCSDIKVGDKVLIRQRRKNKFSTKFDPSPFEVVRVSGTMVTVTRNEKYVTRNISLFKKINPSTEGRDVDDEECVSEFLEEDEEENDASPILPSKSSIRQMLSYQTKAKCA